MTASHMTISRFLDAYPRILEDSTRPYNTHKLQRLGFANLALLSTAAESPACLPRVLSPAYQYYRLRTFCSIILEESPTGPAASIVIKFLESSVPSIRGTKESQEEEDNYVISVSRS